MFRPYLLFLDAALLAVLLAACSGASSPTEDATPPQNIVIDSTQQVGEMDMRVGDTLELSFESNPTTGYQWEVVELNPEVLLQVGVEYVAPTADLLGAPGKEVFRFEAVSPGETVLKMVYHRPFEPEVPPEQTYQVKIIVK
jgi:inhibitor of cysteine peptidase